LRDEYLREQCGADADLLSEVRSLVASGLEVDGTEASAFAGAIGKVAASLHSPGVSSGTARQRIGPYRIEEKLGEGGMGAVYLAVRDDDQYRKKVAVKLIRRGLDAPWLIERFRHERQILASLEHPHIARLLDGGNTEDGLPYLVMEFVEGEPITRYCETRKLPVVDRIRLFRQVCDAVSYAHRNLVIHRDLKPANILATADGGPRLLDFGTAKLTGSTEPESPSHTVAPMMTPDYASPEQVRGEPVTTASDVYSLGVILYELLCGRKPYETQGNAALALERVITGDEPKAPSTVSQRRELRGDLDRIVLMAMHRDPARRYGSVDQLSEDLRRYLEGLPVSARQDSLAYRAGKFIRRNTLAVAAMAIGVATLIAGAGVALWQAREARIAAHKAEQRFADVRSLSNSFLFDMEERLRTIPGTLAVRKTMVDTALLHLDKLSRESGDDPGLQVELAAAYERVGRILGNPAEVNLGDTKQAIDATRRAVALFDQALASSPANGEWLLAASGGHRRYAELLNQTNVRQSRAEAVIAVALGRRALATGETRERLENMRATLYRLAEYQRANNELDASLESAKGALAAAERLAAVSPGAFATRSLALAYSAVASARQAKEDLAGAVAAFEKSAELRKQLIAEGTSTLSDRRNLAISLMDLAGLQATVSPNEPDRALASAEESLRILQTARADKGDTRAALDQSSAHVRLAGLLRKADPGRARKHYLEAIALREALPEDAANLSRRAYVRTQLAELLADSKDFRQALQYLDAAVALNSRVLAQDPGRRTFVSTAIGTHKLRAEVLRKLNRTGDADQAAELAATLEASRKRANAPVEIR
jgi:tetratricopeptide (TPR) repeat protein